MTMLRDLLDDALPALPPSTVDVDRLITNGRRRARLRASVVTMAGVGLVAAAIVATVLPGRPTGSSAHPGGSTWVAMSQSEYDRLKAATDAAFARVAPGVQPQNVFYSDRPWPGPSGCGASGGSDGVDNPADCASPRYPFSYSLAAGGKRSSFTLEVGTAQTLPGECRTDSPGQDSPNPRCEAGTADGMVILDESSDVQGNKAMHYYAITAVHPDGTVVRASTLAGTLGDLPVITREQLIQIVTDPALTLYP